VSVTNGSGPCAVTILDLDQPLELPPFGRAEQGQPYDRLLSLVRLHGDTLAPVEIPLQAGGVGPAELSDRIWPAVRDRLEAHIRAHGCLDASSLTRRALDAGLPSETCGPPRHGSDAPLVSVVLCTIGASERLSRCLSSIFAMSYPAFELVVVDNASEGSETRDLVSEWVKRGAGVRYVYEPVRGLSRARNRGLAAAAGEIIAFTDDDVQVDQEWLSWIVDQFVADATVGVVTGLVMPARLDTDEERRFEQVNGYGRGFEVLRFDREDPPAGDDPLFPYWGAAFGSGNNMAFRTSVLREIEGFDEALGPGTPANNGEEVDAFTRALLCGARLVYEPRGICWHFHRSSEAALRKQVFCYATGTTAVLTKWSVRDPRLLPRILRAAGAVLAPGRRNDRGVPRESARLRSIMSTYREQGLLYRQLAGFALGPFLYAYSSLRKSRRKPKKSLGPGPVAASTPALLITVTDGSPDRRRALSLLLGSLNGDGDRPEVIVVFRGDAPATNGAPGIHTLQAPADLDSSSARNLALRFARERGLLGASRIVGFPDDDCVYPPGLITAVSDVMRETGAEVVCGAYALEPDSVDPLRFPARRIALTPRLVPPLCPMSATFFTGAVVKRVGLLDERFGLGAPFGAAEDTDYVVRAIEAGYEGLYAPDAIFVHHPYKAHRKAQYYEGSVAVLAKHARRVPRLAVSLAYRLTVGAGWVAAGRMRPAHYVRAVRAAAAMVWARGGESERW
jgi:GT2 family glycosyltransferase